MKEELEKIELACVDQLKALKDEQDVLGGRMQAMDDMKASVAEAVYLRVRADYKAKHDGLESQAIPLRAKVREQYAKLSDLLGDVGRQQEAVKLDRQEIELRHQLGEFDKKEFDKRVKAIDAALAEKGEWQLRAQDMRTRFLGAVRDEDELRGAARPPAKAAAAASYITGEFEQPAPARVPVNEFARAAPSAPPPDVAPGGTMVMPAIKAPPPAQAAGGTVVMSATPKSAPPPEASTVLFRPARLVPQNPEAGKATYSLGLKPITIGSDSASDVRVGGPGVEPRHAQISPTPQGYVVTDFETKHGTRVNAEKVAERVLKNEDVVQVGAARFVFRA